MYCVCVHTHMCVHVHTHQGVPVKARGKLWVGSGSLSTILVLGIKSGLSGLVGCRHLYPLVHLACPLIALERDVQILCFLRDVRALGAKVLTEFQEGHGEGSDSVTHGHFVFVSSSPMRPESVKLF